MAKKVIILGSPRRAGNTSKLVASLKELSDFDVVDLSEFTIGHYSYEHTNQQDDFLPLVKRLLTNYDVIVFATPVYWYSMSGLMKVFFDRITDLLDEEKDLARKFRTKSIAVITSSNGEHLAESFWLPFTSIASYLGITYLGNLHTVGQDIDPDDLANFVTCTSLG